MERYFTAALLFVLFRFPQSVILENLTVFDLIGTLGSGRERPKVTGCPRVFQ